MAAFTRGSLSCMSIILGEPNLAIGEDSLMPARSCNLEQTLKDLELIKNKKRLSKSKSTSNINFSSTTRERRNSKTVRFENVCENQNYLEHAIRKTHSAEQIHLPLWMRTENLFRIENGIESMNGGKLHRSQSDSRIQSRGHKKKNILKTDKNLAAKTRTPETGTSKFFNKLKKFWQGMNGKKKTKKQDFQRRFLTLEDSDSKYSDTSKSANSSSSYIESLKSETSGYVTSKPHEVSSYLEAGESDDSLKDFNQKYKIDFCGMNGQLNCTSDVHDAKIRSCNFFWEPRNGFNDVTTANKNDCDACTPDQLSVKSGTGFTNNNECKCKQVFSTINVKENKSDHCSRNLQCSACDDVKDDMQNLTPQTSTDTLVNVCYYSCKIPTLSPQESKGNGFLNYKTSPICCSLESNSSSCRDSESDTKKAIRSLKISMAMRKKMQKLELKQLKEEMKALKRRRARKSDSSRSSSYTSSSATDYDSLGNLLEASCSSCSAAPSIISLNNSDINFRTVLNEPYRNAFSPDNSKCSKLKQQYSLKSPIWSQPILNHKRKMTKSSQSIPQTVYFEQPYKINNQQPVCSPCFMANETQNMSKYHDIDCDPTRWLWRELLLNTPCDVSSANESIITCYVSMYRKQAEEARKRKKGCIIDPLEFRYGYQNEKHSNGPIKVVKKGDAQMIWKSKQYGKCGEKQFKNTLPHNEDRKCGEKQSKNTLLHNEDRKCGEKQCKCTLPHREERKCNTHIDKFRRKCEKQTSEVCNKIK